MEQANNNGQSAHDIPRVVRALRAGFRTLGPIVPRLMGLLAWRLWFSTHRFPAPARERRLLERATHTRIQVDGHDVAVYSWGDGPPVLLVHGWNGRGSQLGSFVEPLRRAGHRVVALDFPAHGQTAGKQTNLFEMVAVLEAIGDGHGPFAGVIAHSLGVTALAMALADGFPAERVVCVSPTARLDELMDKFATMLHIPEPVLVPVRRRVERRFGPQIWHEASAEHVAAGLTTPALIIHDRDDEDVPWQESERIARAWPGAGFIRTEELGHRRILRSRQVIEMATEFLTSHVLAGDSPMAPKLPANAMQFTTNSVATQEL
ncbi:MAG: alpha/beta fold hydrolase [Pseudomonadota bacterium]|nr:MAG: alpha/beta fold hydrolase [Pseudomonadota bacterium]